MNQHTTTRTREQLIETWKRLSRALADERLPEGDAAALRRERDAVQAAIDAIDAEAAIDAGRSLADAHDTDTLAAALFHALLSEQRISGALRAALRSELARLVNELRDAPTREPRY